MKEIIKTLRDRKHSKVEIAASLLADLRKSKLDEREAQAVEYVAHVVAEVQSVSQHPTL